MEDLKVLEILKKAEEERVIKGYSYYEKQEVKFLIETNCSELDLHKIDKLVQLYELLDNMGVDYYELKDEECE